MKKEMHYSNCLLEAIKAKLKNPKNVKVLCIPRGFNIDDGVHFIWEDKTLDPNNEYYFEFCSPSRKHSPYWFKGTVSRTKRVDIHRMMNLVLARSKKLRSLEETFGMKFNQGKVDKVMSAIGDYDWHIVDEEFEPLPNLKDAPERLSFTPKAHKYEPTELKPKIMGYIKDKNCYMIFDFDESGEVITNGEKIDWWKWEMYKDPVSHQSDWN